MLAEIPVIPDVNEVFDWPAIVEIHVFGINISINRIVLLTWLAAIIVMVLFWVAFRKPKIVPRGLQNIMESAVEFIRTGIAREVIGTEGDRYVPFLTTLFFFILVLNLFEIMPGINFPVASRIAIPAVLSLTVYFVFNFLGFKRNGFRYLTGIMFPPGVPKPIYVLLTPIEILSVFFIRPFSLAVRLFANMVAGHILLTILFLTTGELFILLKPVGVAISLVFVAFELFVGFLQAYIFTILSAVYIGDSLHPAH